MPVLCFVSLCLLYLFILFVLACYIRAYMCVLCVVVFYLCSLGYWLNNIMVLLSALKFFLHCCSASRQLSRNTPKSVATFTGNFLVDRG